jgi:hypothetical protein
MSTGNDLSDLPSIQQKRVILRGWWTGESDVEAVVMVVVDIELYAGVAGEGIFDRKEVFWRERQLVLMMCHSDVTAGRHFLCAGECRSQQSRSMHSDLRGRRHRHHHLPNLFRFHRHPYLSRRRAATRMIQGSTFARIATAATSDSVWTNGHYLGSMPVSQFINYFFPAASSAPSPPDTTTFAAVVSDTVKIETDMYDPFVRLPPSAQLHHVQ